MYLTFVLSLLVVVSHINGESCKTPNNHDGDCVLLRECPFLAQKAADKTSASLKLVRESICGISGVDSLLVCCPKSQPDPPPIETSGSAKENNKHLLPSVIYCGYQHSDDFFHDSDTTEITEFPWLARLAYLDRQYPTEPLKYLCVGSLINLKYILTTAVCATPRGSDLIEVRLGEYHTVNDTDCVSDKILEECSEPVRDFKIEKVIVHPEYNRRLRTNDIALVRINGSVKYSDYIRPICLPIHGRKASPEVGDILTMSGWGVKREDEDVHVDIKKRVTGRVISNIDCYDSFPLPHSDLTIIDSHLCTKSPLNTTDFSCSGDGGGPVIAPHRIQWYQEGIVSFGIGICGYEYPEVHTRIRSFVDWIVETIEP